MQSIGLTVIYITVIDPIIETDLVKFFVRADVRHLLSRDLDCVVNNALRLGTMICPQRNA